MNNHTVLQLVAQNSPPWLGIFIGHMSTNVTLSNIALVASIVYSAVNTWSHLRKRKNDED